MMLGSAEAHTAATGATATEQPETATLHMAHLARCLWT